MTHDPANTWCAGRARHGDPSSVCELRTGCAHWRALIDHGRAHQGAPVPEGIAVRWRLCRTDRHDAYRPREATPEPVSEVGEVDRLRAALQRIAALDTYANSVEEARALAVAALEAP